MNKKGVTLIELIVVMVIIGIGATLMAPNIGSWLSYYRLRSATRDVVSTLRTAQMKAVSTNLQYRVNLDDGEIGANSYILQYNSGGIWINEGAIEKLPTGVTISDITFNGKHAEFNPNSTCSGGGVTLQGKKGSKRITLTTATGRVRVD